MNKIKKIEWEELKEGSEANKHLESLRATVKKILKWKMFGHDAMDSGFQNSQILITDWFLNWEHS